MQKLADKRAAIESLLELLFAYRDYAPLAARTKKQGWVSEPSPLDEPTPPPQPVNPDCQGRCYTCFAYYTSINMEPACPPEEKWMREYQSLRRRYRIADLEKSIERLSDHDATLAQAVWAVHVEPWPDPKTEPIAPETKEERTGLAAQGIEWMAHDIKGDVLGYGEKPDPVENQIRQMASQGFTQRRIQRELRCDRNKIRSVLAAVEVRCG